MEPNYYVQSPPQSKLPQGKFLYVIIGAVVAIIIGAALMMMTGSKKDLSVQYTEIETSAGKVISLVNDTTLTRNIQNETLNQIIIESGTNFTSDLNAFHAEITNMQPGQEGATQISQSPLDEETKTKLEDAGLKNRLDSAFRAECMEEIKLVRSQLATTYPEVPSSSIRKAMEKMDKTFGDTYTRLEKINL
jgi:hypothetical protein